VQATFAASYRAIRSARSCRATPSTEGWAAAGCRARGNSLSTGSDAGAAGGWATMETVLKDLETRMQAAVDLLTREFAGVRTGRANTALLDGVRVEAYGSVQPISQMASLSVPDPRTLVIQPWDASQMAAIEKAILKSDLGL